MPPNIRVIVRDAAGIKMEVKFVFQKLAEYGVCRHKVPELKRRSDGALFLNYDMEISAGEYLYELAPVRRIPPSGATYDIVKENQTVPDPEVLDFMPVTAVPPLPVQLGCSVFGTFLDNLRKSVSLPTSTDFKHYVDLVAACSAFYDEENTMRDTLGELWQKYLGVTLADLRLTDSGLCLLTEVKRGVSVSKTEPLMQLNYKMKWDNRVAEKQVFSCTYYPALILQHIGQLLQVGAALFLSSKIPGKEDKVMYQPLASVDLVPIHTHDLHMSMQGVRTCMAIRAAVQDLMDYYDEFWRLNAEEGPDPDRQALIQKWIPIPLIPDALDAGAEVSKLEDTKLVYGFGTPGHAGSCVVKYCQLYGGEVHRAWAAAGHAPNLFGVWEIDGGWFEVRMECTRTLKS